MVEVIALYSRLGFVRLFEYSISFQRLLTACECAIDSIGLFLEAISAARSALVRFV